MEHREENSNLQGKAMNITLLKSVVALIPAGMLLFGSVVLFVGKKSVYSLFQLLGAGCFDGSRSYARVRGLLLVSLDALGS
jgi:hypothetical protein